MTKNELKSSKNSQISNIGSNEIIINNLSNQNNLQIEINKNNIQNNKNSSSNLILCKTEEEKKSKHSNSKNSKKGKEKNLNKKKRKSKDKIPNLLKNKEKVKIPVQRKRRISQAVPGNRVNIDINEMIKSLTPPKIVNSRTDKNGIEINKDNKKLVHITFLDKISPNNKLTETVNIQSFKKYNLMEKNPDFQNLSFCHQCCNIF